MKIAFASTPARPILLQTGLPKTVTALSDHRWVCLTHLSPGGLNRLYRGDERLSIQAKRYELCNSPQMVISMALAGMGIAQLFPSTVRKDVASGALVPILPELTGDNMLFSLVYPSRKHVPLRTRALIDHLMASQLFDEPSGDNNSPDTKTPGR